MLDRVRTFFNEARQEFKHVNWPTRKEATYLTGVVIGLSILFAVLLGAFDFFFVTLLRVFVIGA
ncbi:MAG: preprotein translocase subunit SecE [Candidatus Liptonbacteria bacterium]|nr:preprotein translocase subunit SecE [Candidatus Liptonbacteria bacterium]